MPTRGPGARRTGERLGPGRERAAHPAVIDSLDRSDREFEIEDWLDAHDVPNAWEYASTIVDLGFGDQELSTLAGEFSREQLV